MMALKEKYVVEFAFSDDNSFTEHYLEHKALWLNSNDKIEDYNKIYLPYSSSSELIENKARVITKEGKIINLDDSKILTAKDEETGKSYKYFAFEGVEKGSIIEYFYIEKTKPSYSGTAFRLQSDFDKKNVDFDLYSPSNLVFQFKTYNGLPDMVKDTLSKDKLHWKLALKDLKGLPKEEQAPYTASRSYLVYKLDKNLRTNKSDLSSYGKVAQNIYNYYYTEPSKKAKALIQEFVNNTAKKSDSIETKIRSVDNLIKSSFILSESGGDNLKDLEEILEKKVSNSTGLIKLYVALLRHLEINHEIVITTDREKLVFDKDFEAHNFLNNFLIYFPKLETYLSPNDMETRYGYPPVALTDNYGLFIKEVSVGDFKSGIGKVKYIKSLEADKTVDKMVIDVQFDEENITSNSIKLERSFTGYYAMPFHPYMNLIVGDDRDNIIKGLAKTMNQNVEVQKMEIVDEDPKLFGIKPIKFVVDVKSDAFVEKAGNKYLFKVGEVIGRQIEMYQDKKRTLPLIDDYKRSYYRTINIKLPNGYKVANLKDINIDNTYIKDGEELLSFKSYYTMKDNLISITADEHYRINTISPSIFEDYRKVINSAADFNKITLVLEPAD
ncbi:DUF3857 domain-containing protein [Maribacter algarum]|uniref:DUF3857 domain-containing protein n=2 Tax=Maribacter algarum (ex Zhang et al. 2020) TaxID=2578118 RepID=A0A5S3Q635_9FLAO|nr:DUF3857 domain-containing protein [Maribacter algarum]